MKLRKRVAIWGYIEQILVLNKYVVDCLREFRGINYLVPALFRLNCLCHTFMAAVYCLKAQKQVQRG